MKAKIFQYIDPGENTRLSELSSKELRHLLHLLKNYHLELRSKLNLPQKVTFGVEIEFGCLYRTNIYPQLKKELEECSRNWKLEEEMSNDGLEVISDILIDKDQNWKILQDVCEIISKYGVESSLSGGHVHIGAHLFQNYDDCYSFVKLLTAYENLLYRFGYGEYLNATSRLWYAKPMRDRWESVLETNKEEEIPGFAKLVAPKKAQSVNLKAFANNYKTYQKDNTIEFRFPNGTLNPIIWQNNINVFTKMMLYVQSGSVNQNLLDARISNNHKIKSTFLRFGEKKKTTPITLENIQEYEKIDLEQALEFSDLIFNNNLDKINFLRQYYKNGKISKKRFEKVKNLTK